MAKKMMPAPCEGAGDASRLRQPRQQMEYIPNWARPEISNRPFAIDYAAELALEFAETVHDMDSEDRGLDWASAIQERCDDPLILMKFLPFDATPAVRREAERKLRAWPK